MIKCIENKMKSKIFSRILKKIILFFKKISQIFNFDLNNFVGLQSHFHLNKRETKVMFKNIKSLYNIRNET